MSRRSVPFQRILLQVTSADILESVRALNASSIPIYQFVSEEPLTASLEIRRRDFVLCRSILGKRGDILTIKKNAAYPTLLKLLTQRPVLFLGLLALGFLLLYLPTRILFVEIEGNNLIPKQVIAEAAETAGIRLFAARRVVRSEKMKNALLSQIPELQWAGVNTYGCKAVISVQERAIPEPVGVRNRIISSIVASQDGIIQSATVLRGNLSCREGQAVQKGQILISGYTDCGLCIQATRASGEIYAKTSHSLSCIMPGRRFARAESVEKKRFFSLLFGKKRINLWKDSGIWDSTCGRIYREYPLTLPGGYVLPISLTCDTIFTGPIQEETTDARIAETMLRADSGKYLTKQMIAGTIQKSNSVFSVITDAYLLNSKYDCVEMIGRERMEKIGEQYGKNS